jgi:regulatory protein
VSGLSLAQRALAALARREHSRLELQRKLAPHAESLEQLETVLDDLETKKLLSADRFSQSLVHRREARYGNQRIVRELQEHQLDAAIVRDRVSELASTEIERCRSVWQKKFGSLPKDLEDRARQMRFLNARGFSSDAIRSVLRTRSG